MKAVEGAGDLIGLCETGVIQYMVHGCNCMHAMGSGIAGQLARRYPEVPQADINNSTFADFNKVGTFTDAIVRSVVDPTVHFGVYNAYTQKTPSYDGSDVFEYEAFPLVLEAIKQDIEFNITPDEQTEITLGFPWIGAGLAGGDWPRIRQMILDAFEDHPFIVPVLVEFAR